MLGDAIDAPDEVSAGDVAARYESALGDVLATHGADRVARDAGVDPDVIDAIEAGRAGGVDLADVAAVLAVADETTTADGLVAEARERLLLLMSSAMLDVETMARELDDGTEAGELQAKLEGRFPMTLDEYARLHHFLAARAAR